MKEYCEKCEKEISIFERELSWTRHGLELCEEDEEELNGLVIKLQNKFVENTKEVKR